MKTYLYGLQSEVPLDDLMCELIAFRKDIQPPVGLGKAGHFWNIIDILWGNKYQKHFGEPCKLRFKRNPWAERSVAYAAEHRHLAVLGCANSSKTFTFAAWAIVSWLCDPANTMVMLTSTSLKESKHRIWGSVVDLFTSTIKLPGRLIESQGTIRTDDGKQSYSDKCGIFLIAGERRKEREAVGKLIGKKKDRVIMIADELPELSEALLSAAFSNLEVNPHFEFKGLGNFASILDPLGKFSKPKKGWETVSPESEDWETDYGWCIRFDGLKSPNIVSGEDKFPEIYNNKNLENHRKRLGGENSSLFWRMCRSFPCMSADDSIIYTDADFIRGKVFDKPEWLEPPQRICGVDPAFSNGGDRFSVCLGSFGLDKNGNQQVAVDRIVELYENVLLKDQPRDIQLSKQLKELCIKEGIPSSSVAIDASGPGGLAFGSILSSTWNNQYLPIKFAGKASETAVSYDDDRKGVDAFKNRRSEVWFAAKDPMRRGQIKGLTSDIAFELKQVSFSTEKTDKTRMAVEPKDKMKERLGMSPDKAESFLMMIDLARQRFGFNITLQGDVAVPESGKSFKKMVADVTDVYVNANYTEAIY